MNRFFILSLLVSFMATDCIAQRKEFDMENITQDEGLPSNESYYIFRDSQNFLWFATDQGVVRYNGNVMERYELPDNVIFKIKEDSKGRIWFFSHTGKLAYFFKEKIFPYRFNDKIANNIKNILIVDAYVDDDDGVNIAGAYSNYKISKDGDITSSLNWTKDGFAQSKFRINRIKANSYFTSEVDFRGYRADTISININTKNKALHYTILCRLDNSTQYGCVTQDEKTFYFFADNKVIRLNSDGSYIVKQLPGRVLTVCVQNKERIWVGLLMAGAVALNQDLQEIEDMSLLKDKSIGSIMTDHEGGIWLASLEKGIFFLKSVDVYSLRGDSSLNQAITRLVNVNDSLVLFANTKGVYKLKRNGTEGGFLQPNERITDMFIDKYKNLFVAGHLKMRSGRAGVVDELGHVDGLPLNKIFVLQSSTELIGAPNNRYVLNQGGVLCNINYDSAKQKTLNAMVVPFLKLGFRPSVLFTDAYKKLWIGSLSDLFILKPDSVGLTNVYGRSGNFKKGISTIRQLTANIYAMGVRFGGISLLRDTNVIGVISQQNGLLSNSIRYILPVGNKLWVATAKGISILTFRSYDPLQYSVVNIGNNVGLHNVVVYQLLPVHDKIYAATSNGIYIVEKSNQWLENKPAELPFYINSISSYYGDTSGISSITVPFTKNRLRIKYTAICLNSARELKYQYRLLDTDTNWHTIAGTEILLENLSPGDYKLQLKASVANQHRYSVLRELNIIIEKPWWQKLWYRIALLALFAGSAYYLFRQRVNRVREKERLKGLQHAKILELEQTALRSQMNPHFIFNCLTSIQQLIISGNSFSANEHLVKFARLIRKTLELSSRPYISIADEQQYLAEYLFLEQFRIPSHFDFSITIDDAIDVNKTVIPNMMLQPLVENSIRHGIKHLENKTGLIDIKISQKENCIVCSVTDNGIGRRPPGRSGSNEQQSYGMDIVTRRLQLLTEDNTDDFSLEVIDLVSADGKAAGTRVIIQLPYKVISS